MTDTPSPAASSPGISIGAHADALTAMSVVEAARRVSSGEITAVALVEAHLARIEAVDGTLGSYLVVDRDGALAQAAEVDRKRAANEPLGRLAGVPLGLKDVLVTKGVTTTAGSKILAGWVPPYDGTVVGKLRAADAVIVGKLNCDEFAMGSSTERSAYQPTKNPWDLTRVPGGSSGGSSASVSACLCSASLGTDTGGSIRQPAAFCGVVGIKPTYGRVSRYGVVAFASSLDQVGPLARSVDDAALVLEIISGLDPRDATSLDAPVPSYLAELASTDIRGLRVGIPAEYFSGELDPEIRAALEKTLLALRDRGAEPVDISLPHTHLALPAYYIVAPAEASSNLARYDGIRFGKAAQGAKDLLDLYRRTRGAGFGPEVKRRIMLGTYALRSGYYDAYYKKAQQVRTLIKRDFDKAFKHVDVILTPTTPTVAFPFGAKSTPLDMYLADVFTLSCNLAGIPGISVPCGLTSSGLPIGAQLLARPLDESVLLRTGKVIEETVGIRDRQPPMGTPPSASSPSISLGGLA